jgi:hypothetical protein
MRISATLSVVQIRTIGVYDARPIAARESHAA